MQWRHSHLARVFFPGLLLCLCGILLFHFSANGNLRQKQRETTELTGIHDSTQAPYATFRQNFLDRHHAFFHAISGELTRGMSVIPDDSIAGFEYLRTRWSDFTEQALDAGFAPPAGVACYESDGTMFAWAGYIHDARIDLDQLTTNSNGRTPLDLPSGEEIAYWSTGEDGRVCIAILVVSMGTGIDAGAELITFDAMFEAGLHDGIRQPGSNWIDHYVSGFLRGASFVWFLMLLVWICQFIQLIPKSRVILRLVVALSTSISLYFLLSTADIFTGLIPPNWLDPRFYAGQSPFPISPFQLLLAAFLLFLAAACSNGHVTHRFRHTAFWIFGPLLTAAMPELSHRICLGLIENTGIAWWPDYLNWDYLPVIVPPMALLLILISIFRIALRLVVPAVMDASRSRKLLFVAICLAGAVPGRMWFDPNAAMSAITGMALPIAAIGFVAYSNSNRHVHRELFVASLSALVLIAPHLTPAAERLARDSARQSLEYWIEDQDALRRFALESNLQEMMTDPLIADAILEKTQFHAFALWNRADLSAVSPAHCIELYDRDRVLIDRFGPGIDFRDLPPLFFDQLEETPAQTVFTPWVPYSSNSQSALIGGVAIQDQESQVIGFLIVSIFAGPTESVPRAPEWGSDVLLYSVWNDGQPEIIQQAPFVPGELDSAVVNDTNWKPMRVRSHDFLVLSPGPSGSENPPYLVAVIPRISISARLVGYVWLSVAALCIMSIELLIRKVWTFRRSATFTGVTFRAQLQIAGTLLMIIFPVTLSILLHSLLQTLTESQRSALLRATAQNVITTLENNLILRASSIAELIEQNLEVSEPSFPGVRWTLFDAKGQVTSGAPADSIDAIPTEIIATVFRSNRAACFFTSPKPGELQAHVIMPLHRGISNGWHGTLWVEFPIENSELRRLPVETRTDIDVFGDGKVAASTRPELFNTGFLPLWAPDTIQRALLRNEPPSAERVSGRFRIHHALLDDSGYPDGLLIVTTGVDPNPISSGTIFDFLVIVTAAVILAGLIAAGIVGNRFSRPLRALTEGAERVASGNLNELVTATAFTEIKGLILTFNRMMREIDHQRNRLEERHQFIAMLLQQMSSSIIATDALGRITTANPSAEELFDERVEQLIGTSLEASLRRIGLQDVAQVIPVALTGSSVTPLTPRLMRNGRVMHLRVQISSIEATENRPAGLMLVVTDISATIQASKLEAYAEMARRVAHEVKNPLTPIQLSIEHLQKVYEERPDLFPSVFEQCTRTVLDEVQSLRSIATEFSKFARLPRPEFQTGDLCETIREIHAMFSVLPEGIRFELSLSADQLICRFDPDQIRRVLVNLIQNAIHAIKGEGVIVIRAEACEGGVEVTVEDTGEGMDDVTRARVFEPYFSTRPDGMGLGLAIVRATIEEHGGTIGVESAPGKGTVFSFRLPNVTAQDALRDP